MFDGSLAILGLDDICFEAILLFPSYFWCLFSSLCIPDWNMTWKYKAHSLFKLKFPYFISICIQPSSMALYNICQYIRSLSLGWGWIIHEKSLSPKHYLWNSVFIWYQYWNHPVALLQCFLPPEWIMQVERLTCWCSKHAILTPSYAILSPQSQASCTTTIY